MKRFGDFNDFPRNERPICNSLIHIFQLDILYKMIECHQRGPVKTVYAIQDIPVNYIIFEEIIRNGNRDQPYGFSFTKQKIFFSAPCSISVKFCKVLCDIPVTIMK